MSSVYDKLICPICKKPLHISWDRAYCKSDDHLHYKVIDPKTLKIKDEI